MKAKREGSVARCPVCRGSLPQPQASYGEIHCPRCNAALWHLVLVSGCKFFIRRDAETIYDFMADVAHPQLGLTAAEIERIVHESDPLDIVELVWELEEPA